jgi:hypothetical protein
VSLSGLYYLHKSFYALPHLIQVEFQTNYVLSPSRWLVWPVQLAPSQVSFFDRDIVHGIGEIEQGLEFSDSLLVPLRNLADLAEPHGLANFASPALGAVLVVDQVQSSTLVFLQ